MPEISRSYHEGAPSFTLKLPDKGVGHLGIGQALELRAEPGGPVTPAILQAFRIRSDGATWIRGVTADGDPVEAVARPGMPFLIKPEFPGKRPRPSPIRTAPTPARRRGVDPATGSEDRSSIADAPAAAQAPLPAAAE